MAAPPPSILLSGPSPRASGGISTVLRTIQECALRERYTFARFDLGERRLRWQGRLRHAVGAAMARAGGLDGFFELETFAKLRAFEQALAPAPALVHLHSSHGLDFLQSARMAALAHRRGIPALLHVHGNFDVFHPRWSSVRKEVFRRALRVPERLVVLSEGWKRWFSAHLDEERIVVLPNPVDARRFPRSRADRPSGRCEPVRVLFVGMNEAGLKGGFDLVDAAAAVLREEPLVRFVCAGPDSEGLEATRVRGTASAGAFQFLGPRTREEIAGDFAAADVFVLPSHWEGMPLALLEAMAAGLPVVATTVGAVPEVVGTPGHALLVPPRRPDALAEALLALARDPERRAALGRANREKALREFDLPVFERRLGALYDATLRRSTG